MGVDAFSITREGEREVGGGRGGKRRGGVDQVDLLSSDKGICLRWRLLGTNVLTDRKTQPQLARDDDQLTSGVLTHGLPSRQHGATHKNEQNTRFHATFIPGPTVTQKTDGRQTARSARSILAAQREILCERHPVWQDES